MARAKAKSKAKLKEYRTKRDFDRTPEPSGDSKRLASIIRKARGRYFCVQKHLASSLHYDFRLEHEGVLLSWAVPKGPSLDPADKRLAMQVEEHPLDYGDFEGVIPEGYGAGIVMLWDYGKWKPLANDVGEALEKGQLKFELDGFKLKGGWVLVRGGGGARAGGGRGWLLIKHRDQWSGDIDITKFAPESVRSGGGFADILAAKSPKLWRSHQPGKGGAAGTMLRDVIDQAAKIKASKAKGQPRKRSSTGAGKRSVSASVRRK